MRRRRCGQSVFGRGALAQPGFQVRRGVEVEQGFGQLAALGAGEGGDALRQAGWDLVEYYSIPLALWFSAGLPGVDVGAALAEMGRCRERSRLKPLPRGGAGSALLCAVVR